MVPEISGRPRGQKPVTVSCLTMRASASFWSLWSPDSSHTRNQTLSGAAAVLNGAGFLTR